MKERTSVESDVEFLLRVTYLGNGNAKVQMITGEDVCYADIRSATAYMMWVTADASDLEFEEALTDLCDYAKKFKPLLRVVPGKEGNDEKEE